MTLVPSTYLSSIYGARLSSSSPSPTPTPTPAGTDPLMLSPVYAVDANRSRLDANTAGTGGTPAVGSPISFIADISGNERHTTGDGTNNVAILRTDACTGRTYLEFSAGNFNRMISAPFTQNGPYTVFVVVRPRSHGADRYVYSSRNSYSGIHQKVADPQFQMYEGSSSASVNAATGAWHVFTYVSNGSSSSLQADNGTAVVGNYGTNYIDGGVCIGNGPDADAARAGDWDWHAMYLFNGAMSSPNIAGVKTWLGARVGLTL